MSAKDSSRILVPYSARQHANIDKCWDAPGPGGGYGRIDLVEERPKKRVVSIFRLRRGRTLLSTWLISLPNRPPPAYSPEEAYAQ